MRRDLCINDPKEIFCGHVGCLDGSNAIAAAMQAMHIAAERGLPEELTERMQFLQIAAADGLQPEGYFQTEIHKELGVSGLWVRD